MGIGITPFGSLLNSLKCKLEYQEKDILSKLRLRNCYFCWVCKTPAEFEWFMSIMRDFERFLKDYNQNKDPVDQFNFTFELYLTAQFSMTDISHILINYFGENDPITNLQARTQFGRPMWSRVFSGISKKHDGKIGVFFCGTPLAMPAIKKECRTQTSGERSFIFHKENF